MKRLTHTALLAIVAWSTQRTQALPSELFTPDGEKKFSEFDAGGDLSGRKDWVSVEVIGAGTANDPWGILFTGPFFAQVPGTQNPIDFTLSYKVETTGGQLITGIDQGFSESGIGIGNSITSFEQVWSGGFGIGTVLAQSTVGFQDVTDPDPEWWLKDQLTLSQPSAAVWVTKDIHLILGTLAEGQIDPLQINVALIAQRFHQSSESVIGNRLTATLTAVPDSGSVATLLGIGLTGLGALRKRWIS